jgi:hypothetical protein
MNAIKIYFGYPTKYLSMFYLIITILSFSILRAASQDILNHHNGIQPHAIKNSVTTHSNAQKVKVGFYAQNIYELDPESNTYYMDFYVWFNWKGEIDPTEKIEFMNGVEDWGMTKVSVYDVPKLLADSSYYQAIRVEGRFRENFRFERFPLDEQKLGVVIENSVHTENEIIYYADTLASGYASDMEIPGWEFKNYCITNFSHTYATNFGEPETGNKISSYSALRFELLVSRPANYFIWKLLLPLIIVLLASWGALLLDPRRIDSRILLPITALLTTVFLQQNYSDSLPAVSYLVLLDKIYVLAYLTIIIAIMVTIYTAGIVKEENQKSINRVKKIDRIFLASKFILFVVGVIVLLFI